MKHSKELQIQLKALEFTSDIIDEAIYEQNDDGSLVKQLPLKQIENDGDWFYMIDLIQAKLVEFYNEVQSELNSPNVLLDQTIGHIVDVCGGEQ
tara:strand:- start:743 stop:1024 length:282 start_codon:yes stop_codon:yes gene_type:complete